MEAKGVLEHPEHPPGYATEWKGLKDILKNVFIQQKNAYYLVTSISLNPLRVEIYSLKIYIF